MRTNSTDPTQGPSSQAPKPNPLAGDAELGFRPYDRRRSGSQEQLAPRQRPDKSPEASPSPSQPNVSSAPAIPSEGGRVQDQSMPGQEAAWRMGQQQQTTTSQEHQQRQQQELMTGMRNFAMRETIGEGPNPVRSTESNPDELMSLERTGSMSHGGWPTSSAARKRKVEPSALSITSGGGTAELQDKEINSKSSGEEDAMDALDEGGDGMDSKERVQRRLAQNREAARKSRQRRKKYITDLEVEVHRLRAQGSGGSGKTSATQFPPVPALHQLEPPQPSHQLPSSMGMDPAQQATAIVAAFNRWRLEHALVAIRVRESLNHNAPEAVLRPLVDEALRPTLGPLCHEEDSSGERGCNHRHVV
ncbi:hypothetical protein WJX84_008960 [Apatococcus fuscideae]|uniref:BZIP domain-containing protein n=1 Tax=Apatococcus fuscideae TaxID=2026836 RepID=A0AAW1SJ53_9CHLO